MRDPADIVDVLGSRPAEDGGLEFHVRYVDGEEGWRPGKVSVEIERHPKESP